MQQNKNMVLFFFRSRLRRRSQNIDCKEDRDENKDIKEMIIGKSNGESYKYAEVVGEEIHKELRILLIHVMLTTSHSYSVGVDFTLESIIGPTPWKSSPISFSTDLADGVHSTVPEGSSQLERCIDYLDLASRLNKQMLHF